MFLPLDYELRQFINGTVLVEIAEAHNATLFKRGDEIAEAHRYLESNQQIGKIVVTVPREAREPRKRCLVRPRVRTRDNKPRLTVRTFKAALFAHSSF